MEPTRYDTDPSEAEVLPNTLGLTDRMEIDKEEALGFLYAEQKAIDALSVDTAFTLAYLHGLHKDALGHLYDFAGRLRTVNMSKGGFMFAPAQFLPQTLDSFASEYLESLADRQWENDAEALDYLAEMHAELLYVHPYREGNGRVVRLLTRLIFISKRGEDLDFSFIVEGDNFQDYVAGVQQAANAEYSHMKELFAKMRA